MSWWLLALAAAAASPAALPPELARLQAEAQAWPEDYGVLLALARAAADQGLVELALDTLDQAEALAGANFEIQSLRARLTLRVGHVAQARGYARRATELSPRSPAAWKLRAWTLRQPLSAEPQGWPLLEAEQSYRRALVLVPTDDEARCGLGWSRLALGDRLGARRLFAGGEDPCSQAGAAASGPLGGGWLAVSGGALLHEDQPIEEDTSFFEARAGGSLLDLFSVELLGRVSLLEQGRWLQNELWGSFTVQHRGMGAQVVGGVVDYGGETDEQGPRLAGLRAWATYGPTLRGDFAFQRWPDATVLQGSVGLGVPATSFLTLDLDLHVTGAVGGDGPFASLAVAGTLYDDKASLTVRGRFGDDWSRLDFDDLSIWTSDHLRSPSLEVVTVLRPGAAGGLFAAYELASLREIGATDSIHTHQITFGLFLAGKGALP